jgi:hypothetical protein
VKGGGELNLKRFPLILIILLLGTTVYGDGAVKSPEIDSDGGASFFFIAKKFGMPILKASMRLGNVTSGQGTPLCQIEARVDSLRLGVFFRVNNRFVSLLDIKTNSPLRYVKEIDQEGLFIQKKKYTEILTFEPAYQRVVIEKQGVEKRREISIPPDTYDPLSMFARLYLKDEIQPGQDIRMSVFDGVKLRELIFHTEREQVESKLLGIVEAVRLESTTSFSSFGDREGIIRIWYTTDGKKIPVSMELDLPVGSMRFELVGIEEN